MPVQVFDGKASNSAQLVADLLMPIWKTKCTTAEKVRQLIDGTLKYAAAKRYIEIPNAASLKGPLSICSRRTTLSEKRRAMRHCRSIKSASSWPICGQHRLRVFMGQISPIK